MLSILDTQDEFISKVKKQSEAEVQELKDSLEQSQQLGSEVSVQLAELHEDLETTKAAEHKILS